MTETDPAVRRFWILQLVRFGAVLMVMAGVAIVSRMIDLPAIAGYILILLGAVEFYVVPMLLSKGWRSKDK